MTTTPSHPPLSIVQQNAEKFWEFRRRRTFLAPTDDWGPLGPIFTDGKLDDACVAKCTAELNDAGATELADALRKMSVPERGDLVAAVAKLQTPGDKTRKLHDRLYNDVLLAVFDFTTLELLLHEKHKAESEAFVNAAPVARNLIVNLLVVRLVVNVTRMLDGETSAHKETGSIEALVSSIEEQGFVVLGAELRAVLGKREKPDRAPTGVRKLAERIIKLRNKDIAHLDAASIVGGVVHETAFADYRDAIAGLARIMERIAESVFNQSVDLQQLADADVAARQLFALA